MKVYKPGSVFGVLAFVVTALVVSEPPSGPWGSTMVLLCPARHAYAADMELEEPPPADLEPSQPEIEQPPPADLEESDPEIDDASPADSESSAPEIDDASPADLEPSEPEIGEPEE